VVDTNVFVSALLFSPSVPRQAVDKVLGEGIVLFSELTMDELREVLSRSKFDLYSDPEERELFLAQLAAVAEPVHIIQFVRECRDPKDDKFLEVALNGRADLILTGDADLLEMHPWRGIEILAPLAYVAKDKD